MNRDGGNDAATGRTLVLCSTDSCTMGLICSSRSVSIMAVIPDVMRTLEVQMQLGLRAGNDALELQSRLRRPDRMGGIMFCLRHQLFSGNRILPP